MKRYEYSDREDRTTIYVWVLRFRKINYSLAPYIKAKIYFDVCRIADVKTLYLVRGE
jgi:hypothetical protein